MRAFCMNGISVRTVRMNEETLYIFAALTVFKICSSNKLNRFQIENYNELGL